MSLFQIITNTSCNLRCTYCYEYLDSKQNDAETIITTLKKCMAADKRKTSDNGRLLLDFIGGEPFLVPHLLKQVFDFAISNYSNYGYRSVEFLFSTNGTLLNKPLQKQLLIDYRSFIYLGFSIDGPAELHDKHRLTISGKGSHEDAMKGYYLACDILGNDHVSIKTTFTKVSIPYIAKSLKYLLSLNPAPKNVGWGFNFEEKFNECDGLLIANEMTHVMEYIQSQNISTPLDYLTGKEVVRSSSHTLYIPKKIKKIQHNRCGSCRDMKSIGYDGKVYGCNRFLTMKQDNMELGHFSDNGFIKDGQIVESFLNAYKDIPEDCQNCPWNRSCPDCPAVAVDEKISHKKYYGERRMCGVTKGIEISRLYDQLLALGNKNGINDRSNQ